MTLRVLHIISHLRLGGAQTLLRDLLPALRRHDVESLVYPLRGAPIDIPVDAPLLTVPYRRHDPRKLAAINRFCRAHAIDIIHAHLEKPIIAALLTAPLHGRPVVVHEHGPAIRPGWRYDAYRCALRLLHPRAAAILAVSHSVQRRLRERIAIPPARLRVLPNPLDLARFTTAAGRTAARRRLDLAESAVVLGFVGRLHPVKGPDIALAAFAQVLKTHPDSILLVIGDGPRQAALRQTAARLGIAARVRFLGYRCDVADLVAACDIALMPSRQEPFGIAALEFMAGGAALVCSGADGLAEIVAHEQTALVVPDLTPRAFAAAATRLIESPALRARLAASARRHVQRFDLTHYAAELAQLYRRLLAQR